MYCLDFITISFIAFTGFLLGFAFCLALILTIGGKSHETQADEIQTN